MTEQELDLWFTHLKVSEKEHIATKVAHEEVRYPDCTDIWKALPTEKKQWIYEHRTESHGTTIIDWSEGKTFSY